MIGNCRLDGHSMIVMRGDKAMSLGPTEFVVFKELVSGERRSSKDLAQIVYGNRAKASCINLLAVVICHMNSNKLPHVGLKIQGVRASARSYYELVVHDGNSRGSYEGKSAQVFTRQRRLRVQPGTDGLRSDDA